MKKQFTFLAVFFALSVTNFNTSAQNKALQFSGGENVVLSIPHFNVPTQLTVEAWVKTTKESPGTIISWKNVSGGNDGDAVLFRINQAKLNFGEWIGSDWKEYFSTDAVNTGEWIHLAIVRNGTTTLGYINGNPVTGSGDLHDSPQSTTDSLTIGAITVNWEESFEGEIDEVRIWNVVRTDQEILDNYNKALAGDETGLAGYWQFDDNVNDLTSNGRDGIISGGITYVDSEASIEYDTPSSISVPNIERSLLLYPNPADKTISIDLDKSVQQVRIFNIQGKNLLTFTNPGKTIDVSGLNPGVYMVEIKDMNNEIFISKLNKK